MMLDSRESATYGGKGSVLVQQSCVLLPSSYAQQSAAPMIASSRSPLDREPPFFSFPSPSRAPPSKLAYREATSACTKLRVQAGLGKELAGSGKRPEALLDSLGRYEKGLPDHEEVISDLHSASVSRDYAGRWNCTEWQHADLNYADELAKGHRRRCGSLHGHGSRSVSFRREGTSPVERWPGQIPARSTIGLAHPSTWPDLDRHRWCRLGSAMGRPCSGDSQGRRRLDSGRRQALAWCNASHNHDAHRVPGASGRHSGELAREGHRRAVPAHEVRESKNKKVRRSS